MQLVIFGELTSFSLDNNLILSDVNHFNDVYTFISDDGLRMSWIDHMLSTASLDKVIDKVAILSDQKPVSFTLRCTASTNLSVAHNMTGLLQKMK